MKYINAWIVRVYNFLIGRKIINKNQYWWRKVRVFLHSNICYECEASFGRLNPDRKFYVIRCPKNDLGFFGLFNHMVFHLKLAEEKGVEPVIDWKYYPNDYVTEDNEVGKVNLWESFFEPSSGISVEEVYQSKNVIMSSGYSSPSLQETEDNEELLRSNEIVKKYMKPNQKVLQACEKAYRELGMEGKKILGVKCRGTDFSQTKPSKHCIVPDAQQTIDIIEEKEIEWGGFDYILVSTEDKDIYQRLKTKYGEKMISSEKELIGEVNGKWLNEMFRSGNMDGEKYQRMLEYYVSIWLLSKCDSLIAPVVGGTLGAMRMKGHYEHVYLFHLGAYE